MPSMKASLLTTLCRTSFPQNTTNADGECETQEACETSQNSPSIWMVELAGDENPRFNLDTKTQCCLSHDPAEDIKLLCPFQKRNKVLLELFNFSLLKY